MTPREAAFLAAPAMALLWAALLAWFTVAAARPGFCGDLVLGGALVAGGVSAAAWFMTGPAAGLGALAVLLGGTAAWGKWLAGRRGW